MPEQNRYGGVLLRWGEQVFHPESLFLKIPTRENQTSCDHLGTKNDLRVYGPASEHCDGTSSVYIKDTDGNNVEILKLPDKKIK